MERFDPEVGIWELLQPMLRERWCGALRHHAQHVGATRTHEVCAGRRMCCGDRRETLDLQPRILCWLRNYDDDEVGAEPDEVDQRDWEGMYSAEWFDTQGRGDGRAFSAGEA